MAAEEEEVLAEVEAVSAVYGDDCCVIRELPPHLTVHIRPRTADISSHQFVEAVIGIEAGPQYPEEPPCIDIIESKGLDDKRREHLITVVRAKVLELSSCLMLVALCEEAMETLSNMNHPEGSCPLCLYPLFPEEKNCAPMAFMKLMSCFHCFHSGCIIRWWKWLQEQSVANANNHISSSASVEDQRDSDIVGNQQLGNCPVCRKMFDTKDIEHVLDLLETDSCPLFPQLESEDDKDVLQSDLENSRRQKFEAVLAIQRDNSGLIEPKRTIVISPGMFLQQPITPLITTADTPAEHCGETTSDPAPEIAPRVSPDKPEGRARHHHPHPKKERKAQPSRKWIKKDVGSSHQ